MWNPFRRPKKAETFSVEWPDELYPGRGLREGIVKSSRNLDTYWRHYRDHPFVRAAVTEVVHALIDIPFVAEQFDDEPRTWIRIPEAHELAALLRTPSRSMSPAAFRELAYTELAVTGRMPVWKRRDRGDKIASLVPLDARAVEKVYDANGEVGAYRFNPAIAGQTDREKPLLYDIKTDPNAQPRPAKDVIYIELAHGLSPLAAALDDIDLDYAITQFTTSVMERGAVVDHALITEDDVSEEEANRIERRWFRRRSGPRNAGGLVVVPRQRGTLQKLGMAIGSREMGLTDLRKGIEARILAALDVPPIVVGSIVGLENATYSNYMQARLAFHEENTSPNLSRISSGLTFSLASEFPDLGAARIRPDLSHVMSLLDWEDQRRRLALAEFAGGVTTQTEARSSVDRPPLENGNFYMLPLNMQPIDADVRRTPAVVIPENRMRRLQAALDGKTPFDEAIKMLRLQAEEAGVDPDLSGDIAVRAIAAEGPFNETSGAKAWRLLTAVSRLAGAGGKTS